MGAFSKVLNDLTPQISVISAKSYLILHSVKLFSFMASRPFEFEPPHFELVITARIYLNCPRKVHANGIATLSLSV